MAIYDVNGNQITEVVKTDAGFDFWRKAYNVNGTFGYINNTQMDSDGIPQTKAGYAISGYIPTTGLKLLVSDISKIDIANSKVYYYSSVYAKVGKKELSDVLDGNEIDSSAYVSSKYMCLSIKRNALDFTITVITPEDMLCLENKYVRAYWNNVSYPSNDYTYTEMSKYVNAGLSDLANLRQPKAIYVEIPYVGDYTGYKIKLSEYADMSKPISRNVGLYTPYYAVKNLKADTVYYVQITASINEVDTVIHSYMIKTIGNIRMVTIGNIANSRDIGNKRTAKWGKIKQGKIFRCAKLDEMNSSVPSALSELGVLAELDLRLSSEIDPNYVSPVEYYNVTCGSSQGLAQHIYTAYANVFKKAVELLVAKKPFVIHCKGGADRTGAICAIFEGVLGVSESDINKDYELTSLNTTGTTRNDLDDDDHWFSEGQIAMQSVTGDTLADKYANILIQGGATQAQIESFRYEMLTDYSA